jgi:hypothetical protein
MARLGSMFAKLLLVIVAAGAIACMLLVNRQQRIESAHEMSLIHQRLIESERMLWKVRSEIAERCRPRQMREMIARQGGDWTAIPLAKAPAPALPPQLAGESFDRTPPPGG